VAEIKFWDTKTGREVRSMGGHKYGIRKLAFSPDGKRLASAGKDNVVMVWDVSTGKPLFTLKGHTEGVYGVAWSPNGKLIASCSEVDPGRGPQGEVKIWDAASGRLLRTVIFAKRWRTFAVAFSPDSKRLATASEYGIAVLDSKTGKETASFGDRGGFEFAAVAYSRDGKRLAAADVDETVCVWDTATGKRLVKAQMRASNKVYFGLATVAFSPDGGWVASTVGHSKVLVLDATTGKQALVLSADANKVTSVAFSPDGKTLVAAGSDRIIRLWDVSKSLKPKAGRVEP
jgi:WD40 repeat protein